MSTTGIILVIVFVIAMILGPIATLKTLSYFRIRRDKLRPPPPDDDNDPDKPAGFW
jgi:hypothetical protein